MDDNECLSGIKQLIPIVQRAYGLISHIGTVKGATMDNSERDTHFQGFAKLLWDEISHDLRFLDFGFSPEQQASIDNHIREVIAQRAYDLAIHVTNHTRGAISRDPNFVIRHNVPDFTEWPTPPKS